MTRYGSFRGEPVAHLWSTLLITNFIKIAGLSIAVWEVFTHPVPNAMVIALAAFMMAGAQISEDVILTIVSRIFTPPEKPSDLVEKKRVSPTGKAKQPRPAKGG